MANLLKMVSVVVLIAISTLAAPVAVASQYVYVGPDPSVCTVEGIGGYRFVDVWRVYVLSEDSSPPGARFRLETSLWGPEDVSSVLPVPGVVILSGDIWTGMEITWTSRTLNHSPMIAITIDENPPQQSGSSFPEIWSTRDVVLLPDQTALDDVLTYTTHCYDEENSGGFRWKHPSLVDLGTGTEVTFDILGVYESGGGPFGETFTFEDDLGWVSNASPGGLFGKCGNCPWDWQTVTITALIPEQTPDGTTSELRFRYASNGRESTSFLLHADGTFSVKGTTWGKMKVLYGSVE